MMRSKFTLTIAMLLAAAGVSAAATEEFPIWWSPTLELESLDKIDERRRKRFWAEGIEGLDVFKDGDSTAESAVVENCVSLDRLLNEGFYPLYSLGSQIAMSLGAICTTLDMLEGAKAAEVSFVRDFVMTTEALNYLPAMVDVAPNCGWLCRQYQANQRRISLRRFDAEIDIELKVLSEFKIEARSEIGVLWVEILARADFNGDGLEDLLTRADVGAVEQSTWGATWLFLLTRDTPNGVLWVVDAENELCPDYQCRVQYDEPAALR